MTTETDIVNQALQIIGTRTTVTLAELQGNLSNEAIQVNLIFADTRDALLRMAPWNCAFNVDKLVYITSALGTPENQTSSPPSGWQRGLPAPPWLYEYQYPVDCLRVCRIIPSGTGGAMSVPIYPGGIGAASTALGHVAIRFVVQIDQFFSVIAAAVAAGGTGHAVGDVITLRRDSDPPLGAAAQLRVLAVGAGGAITSVSPVNTILGSAGPQAGSYFVRVPNPQPQGTTTGVGVLSSFNLTFGAQGSQRVVLTNESEALLGYIKQVVDPNVMDVSFQDAWTHILGAKLAIALTGDRGRANDAIQQANQIIMEARTVDGNEALTVNDHVPDWLRVRGIGSSMPQTDFNWGPLWPTVV